METMTERPTLNTFPRRVRVNDVTYDPARLTAWADGTVRVYALVGGKPAVVLEGSGTWVQDGVRIAVTLEDGTTFNGERRAGCGCGNPLKKWPYDGLPS